MDLLRKHVFFLVCGLVGIAGIALGAVGISAMSNVSDGMQQAVMLHQQIGSQIGDPKNEAAIRAVEARIEALRKSQQASMNLFEQYAKPAQLLPDFFPNPSSDALWKFREAYRAAMDELYARLHACEAPSGEDISKMRFRMESESQEFGIVTEEGETPPGGQAEKKSERRDPSGLISESEARESPVVRASIEKAYQCECYALPPSAQELSALQVNKYVYELDPRPPQVVNCWDAQISLWIQQDVVDALVRVNQEDAAAIEKAGEKPWVGTLPIKDVISLRVSPYVFSDDGGKPPSPPGGQAPATPPGTPAYSFTQNASGPEYEVVQFTLKMVVDVRDIPRIVSAICNNKYTTLNRLEYLVEPANVAMSGKIYGPEPIVNVVMDFETVLFSRLFLPIMPEVILGEVGKTRPEPAEGA